MPLYEFQCAACQIVHEVMQKFSDAPMAECPRCQGPVSKLISMSSFALKGSGWYTTDYKRKVVATPTETTPSAPAPTTAIPSKESGPAAPAVPTAKATPAAAAATPSSAV